VIEPEVLTMEQSRERGGPGWNLRCNRCGTYGAEWVPNERPGWGSLALCPAHCAELEAEHERHRLALLELRAVNFEQRRPEPPTRRTGRLPRRRYQRAKLGIPALLLALASLLAAQELEPEWLEKPAVVGEEAGEHATDEVLDPDQHRLEVVEEGGVEPSPSPGLSAIGLCTQREGDGDTEARCDLGVAVPFRAWMFEKDPRRGVAVVGFLGGNVTNAATEGEGLGVAGVGFSYLFPVGERTGGFGVGYAVAWGGQGVDVGEGRLTFGFTIGGRR
jgi:hypothetical protein